MGDKLFLSAGPYCGEAWWGEKAIWGVLVFTLEESHLSLNCVYLSQRKSTSGFYYFVMSHYFLELFFVKNTLYV